jgi:hypothetical protein
MGFQHLAPVVTKAGILVLLMVAMPACSDSPSTPTPPPTQPPPPPPPTPVELAVFTDSETGFSTSDVRDVEGEIVRFNRANNSLIWAADGRSFPGYPVDGNFLNSGKTFQVRFGTEAGEPRAYFTETVPATICDIEVVGSSLMISATNVPVPRT